MARVLTDLNRGFRARSNSFSIRNAICMVYSRRAAIRDQILWSTVRRALKAITSITAASPYFGTFTAKRIR